MARLKYLSRAGKNHLHQQKDYFLSFTFSIDVELFAYLYHLRMETLKFD